jgi:hypothetical protein
LPVCIPAKAWRFAGEMDEVAQTLDAAGLPMGFHRAASEVYRRLAGSGDSAVQPSLEQLLNMLLSEQAHESSTSV